MYDRNNQHYKRYLAGIITESQYFAIIEADAAGLVQAQPSAMPAAPAAPAAAPASKDIKRNMR